jgi:YgiT-type zinc finger domain-containing protein
MVTCDHCGSPLIEEEVTCTIEVDGQWVIIEHVPAKVCPQCGEKLFSPETVERLQQIAWGRKKPQRVVQTPVFDFAASA